jgi:hypothetical protein
VEEDHHVGVLPKTNSVPGRWAVAYFDYAEAMVLEVSLDLSALAKAEGGS